MGMQIRQKNAAAKNYKISQKASVRHRKRALATLVFYAKIENTILDSSRIIAPPIREEICA